MKTETGAVPFFSVVMPIYNGENYVARSIESILAQTDPDWELVIVDDCSSDCSPAIIARYAREDPRIRILRNGQNLNITKSLNRGIEAASGNWIVRIDADDFFDSRYLAKIKETLGKLPGSADIFLSAWVTVVDEYGKKIMDVKLPDADTVRRMMRLENFLYHPATSFPKRAWEKVGGYPDRTPCIGEDTGMWLRFLEHGVKLVMIEESLVHYRIHYSNFTSVSDAKLWAAASREMKALRQNKEWRISLFLKQRMMKPAREELLSLYRIQRKMSLKNLHYFLLTYLPGWMVGLFMWEFRPRLRSLAREFRSRGPRL